MAKTAEPQANWSFGRIKCFPVGRVREYPFDDKTTSVVMILKGQEEIMRHYLPNWAYDNPQYAAMRDIFLRDFGYTDAKCARLSFDDIIDILKRELQKHQGHSNDTEPTHSKMRVPLKDEDFTILCQLADSVAAMKQVEIEVATGIQRKVISRRLTYLRERGLTHRPFGRRGGEQITEKGREYLERKN
jgi:DNA-binding HxlR family transcriptional regulator